MKLASQSHRPNAGFNLRGPAVQDNTVPGGKCEPSQGFERGFLAQAVLASVKKVQRAGELAARAMGAYRMSEGPSANERPRRWVSALVTAVLSISAASATAFGLYLAMGARDTEVFESPLMLSVARQLLVGPWGLYGPFGRQNPLVLIHAPLYYHLAALLAWPLNSVGLDPISAGRFAGRLLSFIGLVVTACSAYGIARLDRAPRRAAWWAVCLIASSPVVGFMPFTVRPDMLGVAFQTTGVFLLLKSIGPGRPVRNAIWFAFAAFGLAICVKQHFVGGPVAGTLLLLWACRRGRASLRVVLLGMLLAFVIVAVFFAAEEVATEGRMSQAVFIAASATARTHPADWFRAAIVVSSIAIGSTCLIALLATAGLAQIASSVAVGQRKFAKAGLGLVGFTVFMPFVHTFHPSAAGGIASAVAIYLCLLVLIPACTLVDRRTLFSSQIDGALCLLVAAEVAIVVFLCKTSTGAWINYGVQGIVFAAILTARSLARACENARSGTALASITIASATVLGLVLNDSYLTYQRAELERRTVVRALDELKRPKSEFYFAGRPGLNRLYGQLDLVYDDWLYPVFESLHLAEARSAWLELALTRGSVRFVVNTSDDVRIDGLDKPLPDLEYAPRFQVGSYYFWERASAMPSR
jgi:Dolichyl-phosphate-mannose-protein mannosyltransferase